MASFENVTAAKLRFCILTGKNGSENVINLVRTLTIRESICVSYLTGQLLLLDNDNVIDSLALEGGSLCSVSFKAPTSKSYAVYMYVLNIAAESAPENKELKYYTIDLVSSEYFTDRGNLTSKSTDVGQTGVSLAQQIWKECKFDVPLVQPVADAPLRANNQPFHIDLAKPFTAIGQIRDIQMYPSYPTGNVLLYRDYKAQNHVPLQYIYETCPALESFEQRETWGVRLEHIFGGDNSDHAIIDVWEQSRASMLNKDAFKKQTKRAYNAVSGKLGLDIFTGLLGAGQNMTATNSDRTPPETDFTKVMDPARYYAACLKSQPQYLVKVPLQTGINITAGKGCELELLPSRSTGSSVKRHPDSGLFLVTDLIHEVHNDLRTVLGTTTFNALKAGGDCLL